MTVIEEKIKSLIRKCKHVYDASKDDPAKKNTPFEQLPENWKGPVCGAPKSAYVKSVNEAGEEEWIHDSPGLPKNENVEIGDSAISAKHLSELQAHLNIYKNVDIYFNQRFTYNNNNKKTKRLIEEHIKNVVSYSPDAVRYIKRFMDLGENNKDFKKFIIDHIKKADTGYKEKLMNLGEEIEREKSATAFKKIIIEAMEELKKEK